MAQADDPAAGPVWLDLEHEQLRRGEKPLHLRPKTFALLRYPVAHPGRVLSKDELMEAVWPKTAISDGVLMVSSNEVRQTLGDMAHAPQYLDVLWRRRSLPAGPGGPGAALPRDGDGARLVVWLAQHAPTCWCRCRPSSRLTPWRRCSVACWGRRVAMIALA